MFAITVNIFIIVYSAKENCLSTKDVFVKFTCDILVLLSCPNTT